MAEEYSQPFSTALSGKLNISKQTFPDDAFDAFPAATYTTRYERLNLIVQTNDVLIEFHNGTTWDGDEIWLPPGGYEINYFNYGVRIKNADAGQNAVIGGTLWS
jgi:hypothetical protein